MVQDMYQLSLKSEVVDVPSYRLCCMANIIGQKGLRCRVVDRHGSMSDDFMHTLVELMGLAGLFDIRDFIPPIGWICKESQGNEAFPS